VVLHYLKCYQVLNQALFTGDAGQGESNEPSLPVMPDREKAMSADG